MLSIVAVFMLVSLRCCGHGYQPVWRCLPGVVWQRRRIDVHVVPDHDAGKLVHGNSATGNGSLSAGLGVFRAVRYRDPLRGSESLHRVDCEFDAISTIAITQAPAINTPAFGGQRC